MVGTSNQSDTEMAIDYIQSSDKATFHNESLPSHGRSPVTDLKGLGVP